MRSAQFWLRLLPVIGLLNCFCVCFQLYSKDLIKVPGGHYQDTESYYNSQETENDVVNERHEISSEEDVYSNPPENKVTSGPSGQSSPTYSLLNSRTVVPEQSELDQVDEDAIKNGHQAIDVLKDDEVVTEVIEDDPTSSSLPLTPSTTTDYQTVPTNIEGIQQQNATTRNIKVADSITNPKPNPEQNGSVASFNDTLSKIELLRNRFSHLNVSNSSPSASGTVTPFNTLGSQTASKYNSTQNLNTSSQDSSIANQQQAMGTAFKASIDFQNKNDLLSRTNNATAIGNSSVLNNVLNRKVDQSILNSTSTNTVTPPETPVQNQNTLIPKLDNVYPAQNSGSQTASQYNSTENLSTANRGNSMVNMGDALKPSIDFQNKDDFTSRTNSDTTRGNSSLKISDLDNVLSRKLGQSNMSSTTMDTTIPSNTPTQDQNTLIQKLDKNLLYQKGRDLAIQALDKKLRTSEKDASGVNFALGAASQTLSSPSATRGKTMGMADHSINDMSTVNPQILSLPNATGGTAMETGDHSDLSKMNRNVSTSTFPAISKVSVVNPLQEKPFAKLTEENEMESYGRHDLEGNGLASKRSELLRQMNPLLNNSQRFDHNASSGHSNASRRLFTFLKTVKEMFKKPETAEDIMGWETWSACSRTCGKRTFRTRQRKCARLVQSNFDVACPEPRLQQQKCWEVSCSGMSREKKLKDFLKMSDGDDVKERPGGVDDQKIIDQMFGKHLDRSGLGEEEKPQDESNSDDDQQEDSEDIDNGVVPSAVATGRKRFVYTVWGSWSACTHTCGQRSYAFRKRYCINAVSGEIKRHCQRPTILAKRCIVKHCPVNGGLSSWSKWSSCSDVCGIMERHKNCTNPKPAYGGEECHKLPVQMRMCGSCEGGKSAAIKKLASYSPKYLCGFDPCQRVGCLENKDAICVSDFECNPTFFDEEGNVLKGCKENANLFLRPLAQKKCSFNPCSFTKCEVREAKCLVDTKCRPFFVNNTGKRIDCKGSNILQISSELICGFNPCQITTCTVDPDAKCVTDYRCNPMFINSAGKRISGCTEDEAEEAERLTTLTRTPSKDEKVAANPISRDQTPSGKHLSVKFNARAEQSRQEQSVKKTIKGKISDTKYRLATIKLLEQVLKQRLHSGTKVDSGNTKASKNAKNKSKYNLKVNNSVVASKKDEKATIDNKMNLSTGSTLPARDNDLVIKTVHKNENEVTEIAEQPSFASDQETSPKENYDIFEKNRQNISFHANDNPTQAFVGTPSPSKTLTTHYIDSNPNSTMISATQHRQHGQKENLENVDDFVIGAFRKKNKGEKSDRNLLESFGSEGNATRLELEEMRLFTNSGNWNAFNNSNIDNNNNNNNINNINNNIDSNINNNSNINNINNISINNNNNNNINNINNNIDSNINNNSNDNINNISINNNNNNDINNNNNIDNINKNINNINNNNINNNNNNNSINNNNNNDINNIDNINNNNNMNNSNNNINNNNSTDNINNNINNINNIIGNINNDNNNNNMNNDNNNNNINNNNNNTIDNINNNINNINNNNIDNINNNNNNTNNINNNNNNNTNNDNNNNNILNSDYPLTNNDIDGSNINSTSSSGSNNNNTTTTTTNYNNNNNSSPLSILSDNRNTSSDATPTVQYKLDSPIWKLMDNGGKSGHSRVETGHQTSKLTSDSSAGDSDVHTDDDYVYPWENYLADMANDNGAPVVFDDTTDGSGSGQAASHLDYNNNNDGVFQELDSLLAKGDMSEKDKAVTNSQNKGTATFEASESAGTPSGNTGNEKGASLKPSSDLDVQIPLYDMHAASNALAKVENEESQGNPSKVDSNGILTSVAASKVAARNETSTPKISDKPAESTQKLEGELKGPSGTPVQSFTQQKPRQPKAKHPNVATKIKNLKLINEELLKAVEDEVSKLKAQGLIDDQSFSSPQDRIQEKQGSKAVMEGDLLDQEENPDNPPVFNDGQNQESDTGDANLKDVDDFLKNDDLGLGDIDGEQQSAPNGKSSAQSDMFNKNEGSIDSPNDYKVYSTAVNDQGDAQTEGHMGENRISEDSGGTDEDQGKTSSIESAFKESYSPALKDEIKELGLGEYYIKEGFEPRIPKHNEVENSKERVLKPNGKPWLSAMGKNERVEDYHKEALPLRYRKKFHMGAGPLAAAGRQAFLRQRNSDGDAIERKPSSYRENGAVERSETVGKETETLGRPIELQDDGQFQRETGDSHSGLLTKYLDNIRHYIGKMDDGLLTSGPKAKLEDEGDQDGDLENALVLNAKDDGAFSQNRIEDAEHLRTPGQVSRKDHVIRKGGTLGDNKDTLEDNKGTRGGNKGTLEDKKFALEDKKGTLGGNKGTLEDNKGTVEVNKGTLEDNKGALEDNKGTIEDNDGLITLQAVEDHHRTPENFGEKSENKKNRVEKNLKNLKRYKIRQNT